MTNCIANLAWMVMVAQQPAPDPDLTRIERTITKEPEYVAEPRYALLVLDAESPFRCWMVFDKTTPDSRCYDVLYLDRDGDGDLTDADERMVSKYDESGEAAGVAQSFRIAELRSPDGKQVHRDFLFSTSPKEGRTGFWFRFRLDGKHEFSGGYYPTGVSTTTWAATATAAPIFRPSASGPFRFALWQDDTTLRIGEATRINVLVGTAGVGDGSLLVVDENFLDLEADELTCTVVAEDATGQPIETHSRIRGHC
jgi:hypothetical protein